MAKTPGKTKQVLTGFCPRAFSLIAVVRARCSERLLRAYSVENSDFGQNWKIFPCTEMEENFGEGPAKMGLKRCCGPLKPFAAILNEFRQRYAFRGNFRNPNIGVFQQNMPKVHDAARCTHVCNAPKSGFRFSEALSASLPAASLRKPLASFGLTSEMRRRPKWHEESTSALIVYVPGAFSFSPNLHGM